MSEGPTRLVHEDPDFARLVAASKHHEPASKGIDETLSLVTQAAMVPRRSTARLLVTSLVTGVAIIGASVVGVLSTRDGAPSPSGVALTTSGVDSPAPRIERAAEAKAEPAVASLSVNELATEPATETAPPAPTAGERSTNVKRTAPPRGGEEPVAPKQDAPAGATSSTPGPNRTTFSEELALLSSARSALEAENFGECIRAADRYDERFRSGLFHQEIAVVRISALVKSGERARGEALARQFLAVNADSPYAGRVRALVERP